MASKLINKSFVNIDSSEVVWRSQPRACNSISRYGLEAGSARSRLARKMDTYIASLMAELPKTLERRDTSTCTYLLLFMQCYILDHSACSISSRGNYSRATSISFHACSGATTIQGGIYSRAASIWSYTVHMCSLMPTQYQSLVHKLLSDISPLPDWPCAQSHIPLP